MIDRIRKFGVSCLSLNCSRAVIEEMIDKYIDKCKECFSFQEICKNIKHIAEEKGYFEKEENTEYSQVELTREDIHIINRIVWKKIGEKILIIDFDKSGAKDFYFIKIDKEV